MKKTQGGGGNGEQSSTAEERRTASHGGNTGMKDGEKSWQTCESEREDEGGAAEGDSEDARRGWRSGWEEKMRAFLAQTAAHRLEGVNKAAGSDCRL